LLAGCTIAGLVTEYIMVRRRNASISMACFVTCMLYALSLPPLVPFWIAIVGIVVAILFGKEVFGGFGRNFANPAIVGRAFVYICFPTQLTAQFVPAFRGFPGGLVRWSYVSGMADRMAEGFMTQASPLWVSKNVSHDVSSWWELGTGMIGQTGGGKTVLAAGSIGEGCAVLIVLAAIYLLVTKTANWKLMVPALAGVVVTNVVFRTLLGFDDVGGVAPLHITLLGGTALYATVFMVTDPVSAPKKAPSQYIYGFLIGSLMVLIRWRGIFVAAATFSILIGNLIGPLLDLWVQARRDRRKAASEASQETAA